ncbi:phosphoribosylformylglycinamidine cyclo-ligase [Natronobacterium gregoryi]|uniref:Phosphoribosylformylglycinamidine cyclo-ligase n=2 Tax=Natronobacterium gregoryi TaxID=44930 RepID=L0ALM1_NATGS|nr:phosphoribosylformylglycinamidine cyclo-ligase [Natronobacterium gregoryi]AFZ74349.1 phosphoribosylaminoimidazole synthetase [Natronobacterium gregoryi SP2]ELY63445.1 phosphoribosylaminoimidazole synthetase [Natronobacterium gregoryi SP2]PLK22140.1 phosphoribosylformylglycinamidine cyclo-ligase [Natronobacterium gregoryi SP2]SFI54229.1 phosphoribosylformylglycinamidine cyclo-ligase [Natronobacterium gregoryi]
MTDPADDGTEDRLTYADTGVDIEASENATAALLEAFGSDLTTEYAGLIDIGDRYLALATDGVGTKLLVAEAIEEFSTIGIDCIAMNVNDLVAAGVEPVGFVDYLAIDDPDETITNEIGEGLAVGLEEADLTMLGGETAVMPDVVQGFDLAGTCAGLAAKDELLEGEAAVGDTLVGFPSNGIHSNGLTLAREAVTRDHEYTDPFPYDDERTIGEELLRPTRIYTDLLESMHDHGVRAAAHVTGGGWTNLLRMGKYEYAIDDPCPAQSVFKFVQEEGNVTDEEMHRTFNMGTGFVVAVPEERADDLVAETDGRIIGHVEDGRSVEIRGLSLS